MAIEPKRLNGATLAYDTAASVDGENDLIPVASAANAYKLAKVTPNVFADGISAEMSSLLNARKGVVDLRDFSGLDLTGVNDNASIVTAALVQARTAGYAVQAPAGVILIGSSVTLQQGDTLRGVGHYPTSEGLTQFKPGMTDGTACFIDGSDGTTGIGAVTLEKFVISTGYNADPASAPNCIGLEVGRVGYSTGTVEGNSVSRSTFRDIHIRGCAYGLRTLGWLNTFDNIFITRCNLGFWGRYLNNTKLDLILENNTQAFIVADSDTPIFERLEFEGNYESVASVVESSQNVLIFCIRAEHGSPNALTTPWMTVGVGGSGKIVHNFRVFGGQMGRRGVADDSVVPMIQMDYVEGWSVGARMSGQTRGAITTTANTKGGDPVALAYTWNDQAISVGTNKAHVLPLQNIFPNPTLDGLRNGSHDKRNERSTVTSETTLVRTGRNAIRVTCTNVTNTCFLRWKWNSAVDGVLVDFTEGKTFTVGAWVWVPDTTTYDPSQASYATPMVVVSSLDSGGTTTVTANSGDTWKPGAWNFMHATITFQTGASHEQVEIRIVANNNASHAVTTADYVVVDSIYMVEGDDWRAIFRGDVVDAAINPCRIVGGRMEYRATSSEATTIIADTTQTFQVGDTIIYTDAAAGGVPGIYCTTGGAGGTAVFKNMAALAA